MIDKTSAGITKIHPLTDLEGAEQSKEWSDGSKKEHHQVWCNPASLTVAGATKRQAVAAWEAFEMHVRSVCFLGADWEELDKNVASERSSCQKKFTSRVDTCTIEHLFPRVDGSSKQEGHVAPRPPRLRLFQPEDLNAIGHSDAQKHPQLPSSVREERTLSRINYLWRPLQLRSGMPWRRRTIFAKFRAISCAVITLHFAVRYTCPVNRRSRYFWSTLTYFGRRRQIEKNWNRASLTIIGTMMATKPSLRTG